MGKLFDKIDYDFHFNDNGFDLGHTAECFVHNEKYGVKVDGIVCIPANYDKIKLFELPGKFNDTFIAFVAIKKKNNQGKKWGIISSKNEVLEEIKYDNIFYHKQSSTLILNKGDKYYALNINDNILRFETEKYSYISDFYDFDNYGNIPDIRAYLEKYNLLDRKYAFVIKNNSYGIILDDGHVLIEPRIFTKINKFSIISENGNNYLRALAKTHGRYKSYIDIRGYFWGVIPPYYNDLLRISNNRYIVQNSEKKWGIIDNNNKEISNFEYSDYFQNKNPLFPWKPNNISEIFVCDLGKVLVDIKTGRRISDYFDNIKWCNSDLYYLIEKNSKYGIISVHGDVITSCIYDRIDKIYHNDKGIHAKDVIFNNVHGIINNNVFISDENSKKTSEDIIKHFDDSLYQDDQATYDRYAGTYAQDVMGYSDDDIDIIFDGEPDAYWNID